MPVLDVVVNPSGALSGARTVQRGLADIGRSAVGMERTMGGAVSRLTTWAWPSTPTAK